MLRENVPDLKIRIINVVDLFKFTPSTEHQHGLSDWDFASLFIVDKPIIFEVPRLFVADPSADLRAHQS